MPQILENLVERGVELRRVLREKRAAAADRREAAHQLLQRCRLQRSALADHVNRRVRSFRAANHAVEGSVAGLVVAVAEDDHRMASCLPAQQVHRFEQNVVERRPAPRRQSIDGLHARRRIRRAPRESEDVVVEPE